MRSNRGGPPICIGGIWTRSVVRIPSIWFSPIATEQSVHSFLHVTFVFAQQSSGSVDIDIAELGKVFNIGVFVMSQLHLDKLIIGVKGAQY